MSYEKIDNILKNWADTRNLYIYKIYKEEEVRSIEIVGNKNGRYQLWLDAPDEKGQVCIHIWDYKKRKKDFFTQEKELFESLETAYHFLNKWESE